MKIAFTEWKAPKDGAALLTLTAERKLGAVGRDLDRLSGGQIARALAAAPRFKGEKGQWLEIAAPAGTTIGRLLVAGLGAADKVDALTYEAVGGEVARRLGATGDTTLAVAVEAHAGVKTGLADAAARIAFGARLGSYRFDKYRTRLKPEDKPALAAISIGVEKPDLARKAFADLDAIAAGVSFTRDLVSEPANILFPAALAAECKTLSKLGVKVEVLGEAQMKKLGMGALLGVGQGSVRESQLVVMTWEGGKKKDAPVAFVGKGVCFDTGGISLKPAAGMEEMKWDMGGAGTVIGAMKALAGRKAKANVVGLVGLVENMPDGNAQRPGDIVTSMSGQTIDVINTDAEGRLVLADVMWYAQERFKPQAMIDLATLTGAIIISLGHEHAGLFANDDVLADRILAAGKAEGEPLWRMPLSDAYDKGLNSPVADMQNIAGPAVGAGSIVAAQFLKRFVKDTKWAHIDIAGVAWSKADKPTVPKGATGYGVRVLDRLIADNYEGK